MADFVGLTLAVGMMRPIALLVAPGVGSWILRLVAWWLTVAGVWGLYRAGRDAVSVARRMHEIPCSGCQYFTQDYFLKCTVHPHRALSEEAIGCRDYEA